MIVVGFVILVVFILYEMFLAPKPIMNKRVIQNRAFLCALGLDVSIQLASGLRTQYFSSYILIIKDWPLFTRYVIGELVFFLFKELNLHCTVPSSSTLPRWVFAFSVPSLALSCEQHIDTSP